MIFSALQNAFVVFTLAENVFIFQLHLSEYSGAYIISKTEFSFGKFKTANEMKKISIWTRNAFNYFFFLFALLSANLNISS